MNEKLQYATMLDIPVNTCNITNQTIKKKRNSKKKKVNPEQVKEELIVKVNSGIEEERIIPQTENLDVNYQTEHVGGVDYTESIALEDTVSVYDTKISTAKKKFKFTVIGVQLAAIGVLIATIFLTNAFYADSGINVFFRSVFGSGDAVEVVDERTYEQFAPVISVGGEAYGVEEGVITFTGKGSVYAPCNGTVSAITEKEDGTFDIEIMHSDNFKTLLCGLQYVYANEGDGVFNNIPVGYYNGENANMCFVGSDGAVISEYKIVDNSVVWEA